MDWTRRQFLGASALLGLPAVPRILRSAAASPALAADDGVLVVLQLSGGNDALNTVAPYLDPVYRRARPTLAVPEGGALSLEGGESHHGGVRVDGAPGASELALHPEMKGMWELYRDGELAIVQGVGYPNPSRSHFRSMDIWHTARPEREEDEEGWLGRVQRLHGDHAPALDIGHRELPLALRGEVEVASLQNLDWLQDLSSGHGKALRRRLEQLYSVPRAGAAERVRELAGTTLERLERLVEIRSRPLPVEYPDLGLAEKLSWAGQLISGGFPARIYYLSLDGFDTHSQQKEAHERLLAELSSSLSAFLAHLRAQGSGRRVVVMVFSEFGRRVHENGSRGTDHGVAAPVLLLSGGVRGGVYGPHPSLTDLDDGDLRFHTDFRRVYATVLEGVLKVPPEPILGAAFEKLPIF